MAAPQNNGRVIADINMTPLVDILLVLLVIFIVTARVVVTQAVPVELPKAASGETVQTVIAVSVPVDGPLYVDGKGFNDDAALVRQVRNALAANKDLRAVIQGDGSSDYSRVIRALDLLKQAGVTHIAFASQPTPAVKP